MELEFGGWLKKRRRRLDLTQDDLAQRATCSVNTVRKIEAGVLIPSKELAALLGRALAVPPEFEADFVRFARTAGAMCPENAFADDVPAIALRPVSSPSSPLPPRAAPLVFELPAPLTAAIGRERDTEIVSRVLRLPAARLVTLTGPPGTGKTRLALQVAWELQKEFSSGAAFVALAPVAQPALVESAVGEALGVRGTTHTPLPVALREMLRDKELLLVLDNFEHVLDAAALVTTLLTNAPRLKILTTSRERLRVYGERELPIAPLVLPPIDPMPAWNEIENFPAVQLFVDRAQAVRSDFEVTPENAAAIVQLCRALDGMPLAIEMAAARVKWETPQQLLPQLTRQLEKLQGRPREREPRQQTLRSAIDWSYERLDNEEQFVLRQLGVFRGGFTTEAAQAVCDGTVGELLESLVEKSLVKMEGDERFTLLEMIREYALEKLEQRGESDAASERHAAYFTGLAEDHEPAIRSAGGFDLAHALDPDRDNLRAALEWSVTHQETALALRLASALAMYWDRKSAVGEGTRWLDRVLAMETPSDEELLFARAKARDAYAEFIRLNGDYSQAREMLHAALDDWRGAGERGKPYLASALIPSSRVALDQGDFDLAHALAMEALQVNTDLGDMAGLCQAYRRLADVALTRGELDFAGECLRNALRYAEECDSDHERCTTLRLRGDLARVRGDFDASRADYTRALELNENIKDDYADIRMSRSLGVVAVLEGDVARGMERIRYAARLCDTVGNYAALALAFSNAAMAAALTQETRRAMRLLGAMDNLVAQVQMQLIAPDSFEYERTMEIVKAQAEDRELECWRAEGRGLTYREALGELLDN